MSVFSDKLAAKRAARYSNFTPNVTQPEQTYVANAPDTLARTSTAQRQEEINRRIHNDEDFQSPRQRRGILGQIFGAFDSTTAFNPDTKQGRLQIAASQGDMGARQRLVAQQLDAEDLAESEYQKNLNENWASAGKGLYDQGRTGEQLSLIEGSDVDPNTFDIQDRNASTSAKNATTSRMNANLAGTKYEDETNQQTTGVDDRGEFTEVVGRDEDGRLTTEKKYNKLFKDDKEAKAAKEMKANSAMDANNLDDSIATVDTLLNHKGFDDAFGYFDSKAPTIGADASEAEGLLETVKSQQFMANVSNMRGMGALSDAEGKKIQDMVAALDPSMNQEALRKNLGRIKEHLTKLKAIALFKSENGKEPSASDLNKITRKSTSKAVLW